jgi:hypothetical protein
MEDVGEKIGRMLNAEASRNRMLEGQDKKRRKPPFWGYQ